MKEMFEKPIVYAVKHNDDERKLSQSGGMFAAVSNSILERGGIVYGCLFDEKFEAVHARAETKEERDKMRYSKYVQSNMLSVMQEIVADLKTGRAVLFSGTSCQVAGLKSFIGAKNHSLQEKLYCIDIVCHGVPSPLVWKDYLDWESKRAGSEIKAVVCRNKQKYGWHSHVTTIDFEYGKSVESRTFPRIFYGHNALRPSCYKCPYKDIIHPGDITIADYWGIEVAQPGFKDDKGVSLVLINDDKGSELFDCCKDRLEYVATCIEDSMQKPLIAPYDRPKTREQFWHDYKTGSFAKIAKKYGGYGFMAKVKRKLRVMKKYFKK